MPLEHSSGGKHKLGRVSNPDDPIFVAGHHSHSPMPQVPEIVDVLDGQTLDRKLTVRDSTGRTPEQKSQ